MMGRMAQVTIHVPPRPYQARIENGLFTRAGARLAELLPQSSRIFVLTVAPVYRRWGPKLLRSLKASGFKPQLLQMPAGHADHDFDAVDTLGERRVCLSA